VDRRPRKVTPTVFLLVVVLGFAVERQRTLAAFRRFFRSVTGLAIVSSAFQKRFNSRAVVFLRSVFAVALARHLGQLDHGLGGKLARFRDVVAIDATVVRLHDLLAKRFPATRTNHTKAAAKLHVTYSLTHRAVARLAITSERVGDRAMLDVGDWMAGKLVLFDLGYYEHKIFARIAGHKAFFISRLKDSARPTIVAVRRGIARGCAAKGKNLWEVEFAPGRPVDLDVRFKAGGPVFRVAGTFNRGANRWHLYVTNLPPRSFSPAEIADMYRLRWEIELLFKELKSTCRLEELPSSREEVVLVLIYATLLSLLVSRALARWAGAQRGAPSLSHRLVTAYLPQIARSLAHVILGGSSWSSQCSAIAADILAVCGDPHTHAPSVLARLGR
jgi:putative transposase